MLACLRTSRAGGMGSAWALHVRSNQPAAAACHPETLPGRAVLRKDAAPEQGAGTAVPLTCELHIRQEGVHFCLAEAHVSKPGIASSCTRRSGGARVCCLAACACIARACLTAAWPRP